MTTATIPERGAPPLPEDWPRVHDGPAAFQGAIPTYLLDRGPVPEDGAPDHEMEVDRGGEADVSEVCDVVVVGSGAGGATVAKELAEKGLKVIVVEEGDYFTSKDFVGPPIERIMRFCKNGGATPTLGKVQIPLPLGRTVGGTTTVNSGTCFRAPRRVLSDWEKSFGLESIDYETMDPYFRRVEKIINVRPVPWDLLGPNGWVTHWGSRALGHTGGPILRNITACHGSGQCAFGCPTDAKQAMHLSYLPRAWRAGTRIYARTSVEWVSVEQGRATGIVARFLDERDRPLGRLSVKSKIVVVAGGAIGTPVILLGNRIANRSGQVGRNLSIHPATGIAGWFPEKIFGWRGTLQSYYVDSMFDSHGVMLEATNSVPSVTGNIFPGYGSATKEMFAAFPYMSTIGLMVADTSKGRVRRGLRGEPVMTYKISDQDTRNLYRGMALAAEILLAGGALQVTPGIPGLESVNGPEDIQKLRNGDRGAKSLKLTAFHPTGTAGMGRNPETSVVDGWLQAHDVPALYITDGSVFPTCPGVNPQLTIMAFATRTADRIAEVI